ncbi:MAG: OmpA family protein [Flavobacteriaceae bacterium]|nr:OmpA family protein [Flavobacteriaceae bacterium]
MKKSITHLVLLLTLLYGGNLFGQLRVELGDKYFDQFAYKKAIRLYAEAIEKDGAGWTVKAKLADCYYFISKPAKAVELYKEADGGEKQRLKSSQRYRYALCLQSLGQNKQGEAKTQLTLFYQDYTDKDLSNLDFRSVEPTETVAENLSFNSTYSDFGAVVINDTLYFTSSREKPNQRKHNKKLYKWNEQPFLDIYSAELNNHPEIELLIPEDSLKFEINTVAHEAGMTIFKDSIMGKEMMFMYYSGGEVNNNKIVYNKRGVSNLKLMGARRIVNQWVTDSTMNSKLERLNLDNFSVGNPAISPDKKRLFFVTCAPYPEAKGQTDIYYSDINKDGSFKKPVNLSIINTPGRESFPFVASDGTLYFSSDGPQKDSLGLGMLDIYRVRQINKVLNGEAASNIEHLGRPFNSEKDDFAFFIDPTERDDDGRAFGYFTSNRARQDSTGIREDDDIYRAKLKIEKKRIVIGVVSDIKTKDYLEDAIVELIDSEGKILDTLNLNSSGSFKFEIDNDRSFNLRVSKTRYFDRLITVNPSKSSDDNLEYDLELEPYPCDLYKRSRIEFARNSSEIDSISATSLNKLRDFLMSNSEIRIRIESHTDAIGSDVDNLKLSQKRADATEKYLTDAGVDRDQILSAVGLGENCPIHSEAFIKSQPSEMSDDYHRQNRRSKFIIEDCEGYASDCIED